MEIGCGGWEGDRVERLDKEILRDALADPELNDAADWIWKLCMQVISAAQCEKASLDAEFSPIATALTVGGLTERKIGHAFDHFARTALRHAPGQVPYSRRVGWMRSALYSIKFELADYWRAPSLYEATSNEQSFFHAIFQDRYEQEPTAWKREVMGLKECALTAIKQLAAEYSRHYDTRKAGVPPSAPSVKGVSVHAGQRVRSIVVPRSSPQTYIVKDTAYTISAPKAIAVVDRLIAAYESHEGAYIDLPAAWQSNFKRGGASAFRQFIEYEVVNNRPTGRARLSIPNP